MTFYLKYRSKTLDELDIQEVREQLTKIVESGKIPHAFLFSGPKGTGKTSAARIMAKIVNCEKLESNEVNKKNKGNNEPCNTCNMCISISKGENLDVIELDAASHRGIDDIRALRDAVKLAPAKARKKVYIIDEAHMLTTEASNALLKTLEEPPEHVMFILATTNPEKLIDTVRSRTITVNFRKATNEELVRALKRVVKGENIKMNDDVLLSIARNSDGSFRDAVKTLEQISLETNKLTLEEVEDYLYKKKIFNLEDFLKLLASNDVTQALLTIETAISGGVTVKNIISSLIDRIRDALLADVGLPGTRLERFERTGLIKLLKLLQEAWRNVSTSVLEQIPLEIAVVEWCESNNKDQKITTKGKDFHLVGKDSPVMEKKVSRIGTDNSKSSTDSVDAGDGIETVKSEKKRENIKDGTETRGDVTVIEEIWAKVLTEIRPRNTSTEALLRASRPIGYDGNKLVLGVYYQFHKERLETNPHRDLLEETVASILGNPVRVRCILTEPPLKKVVEENGISTSEVAGNDVNLTSKDGSSTVLTETHDEDIIKVAKEVFGS